MTVTAAPVPDTVIRIPIHRGQAAVLASDARIVMAVAGSGGGKTTVGPPWLMREIATYWDRPTHEQLYLVAAPTHRLLRTARDTIAPYLKRIGARGVGDSGDGWKPSEDTWYLASGGQVRFGSADNPGALEAVHYRAEWLDEWGQVDDYQHATALRRGAFFRARILITTTPYPVLTDASNVTHPRTWLRAAVIRARGDADPETAVINWPSWWNPGYPIAEIRRARRDEPPWRFAMFIMGEADVRPEGAIYDIFTEAEHIVDPFPLATVTYGITDAGDAVETGRSWWPVYAGGDFGAGNETAFLWAAHSPDDVLVIFGERYAAGRTLASHAVALGAEIPQKGGGLLAHDGLGWGPMEVDAFYGDPSAAQSLIDLRDYDIPARGAENDVEEGIREVWNRLATRRLLIVRGRAPNLVRGLLNYRRGPGGHPIKVDDHAPDACRYLCMGVKRMMRGSKVEARYA